MTFCYTMLYVKGQLSADQVELPLVRGEAAELPRGPAAAGRRAAHLADLLPRAAAVVRAQHGEPRRAAAAAAAAPASHRPNSCALTTI